MPLSPRPRPLRRSMGLRASVVLAIIATTVLLSAHDMDTPEMLSFDPPGVVLMEDSK